MAEFPDKISIAGVLDLYEGRKPSAIMQPAIEKLDFNKNDVRKKMNDLAGGILKKYKNIIKESEGIILDRPDVWKKLVPIEAVVIDEAVPLTLFVMKSFFREGDTGEETVRISFNLVKGKLEADNQEALFEQWRSNIQGGNLVSTLEYIDKGTLFDLKDRMTDPKFRGQGFAGMLLEASESFIRQNATDLQKNNTSYVDVAQLDAVSWLYNKGYRPQTSFDEQRLAEVLDGDEKIVIGDKYYIYKDIPEDERVIKLPDGREIPNKKVALRIKLAKEIPPGKSETITDIQQKTSEAVRENV